MMPTRHSQRTFLNEVFIRNTKSFWRTSSTLTYLLSFTAGNGSHCVTSQSLVLLCLSRSFTLTCTWLIVQYLFSLLTFEVCAFLSHHLPLHVLFLFFLYAHASYYLYTIYYFCFTQKCLDEFCLKCFRNTGCQSLFAINSLLAKFFKRLC